MRDLEFRVIKLLHKIIFLSTKNISVSIYIHGCSMLNITKYKAKRI